jgi:hypothetical protein
MAVDLDDIDAILARMKAADKEDAEREYQAGHQAGLNWARSAARPKELRRIFDGEWKTADDFARLAWPEKEPLEFWVRVTGDVDPFKIDADFMRGFGDGAEEVWRQVRFKL